MTPAGSIAAASPCAHCVNDYMERMNRTSNTVTSIEELAALPFQSVIRDADGHVLERWGDNDAVMWMTVGVTAPIASSQIALPAKVLDIGTP